jgi:hypothetical protein
MIETVMEFPHVLTYGRKFLVRESTQHEPGAEKRLVSPFPGQMAWG